MRIIAGRFRSRKLLSPKDALTTRPIPDRVKESLFGMLRGNCEGASVLDCFAGTGAIGLEALSRGAKHVVFVERDRRSADMLRANIQTLGVEDEVELVQGDALGAAALNRCPKPVDLAFFDPPYPVVLDPAGWERVKRQLERVVGMLSDTGFLVLRTPWPFRQVSLFDESGRPLSASERTKYDLYGRRRKPGALGQRGSNRVPREKWENRAWEGDEVDIDAIEEESSAELEAQWDLDAAALGVKVVRTPVDLELGGAVGPETHEYASQAVHLYMRRKGAEG